MTSSREQVPRHVYVAEELSPSGRDISAALLDARRRARALTRFPGKVPDDLVSAYRIQSHSIRQWNDRVAGWKVGGIPPKWVDELGASWLTGPIFSESIRFAEASNVAEMPVFENGFAAIEPELIIQLGETREHDRMFIGAEIASSPVPAINDYGPAAVVCDFGNNNGVLLGQEISDWVDRKEPIEVAIWIDGDLIGQRVLADPFAGAIAARNFCFENARERGIELSPDTLISSGAITGVHEATIGSNAEISFGPLGALKLALVPAAPSQNLN